MRKAKRTLAGVAAMAVLPLAALTGPSAAAPDDYQEPEVAWARQVYVHGDVAVVTAKYRCWGGNEGTHLWVSLKQGRRIRAIPADELAQMEGTSRLARAWYDTNAIAREVGAPSIDCDGTHHKQTYVLGSVKADLRPGRNAFLQFCLFDSTADSQSMDTSHGFAYKHGFRWLRRSTIGS